METITKNKPLPNLATGISIDEFREFVGDNIFTVEFYKKPTKDEPNGEYRKMNARLGVAKYVKNTTPEATAKRTETNAKRMQIGCFEMRGTSDRIEAENYRTLALSPDRLISITAKGVTLVNKLLRSNGDTAVEAMLAGMDLGEDRPIESSATVTK